MTLSVSLSERHAEAMAAKSGYGSDQYRASFMLGVMKVEALDMERALYQIASGRLSADAARKMAKSVLEDMEASV